MSLEHMVYLSAHIRSISGIKVWKHSFFLVWKTSLLALQSIHSKWSWELWHSYADNSSQNHIFFDCLGVTGKHRKLFTWLLSRELIQFFISLCSHSLNFVPAISAHRLSEKGLNIGTYLMLQWSSNKAVTLGLSLDH